jgi:hypothetical protein
MPEALAALERMGEHLKTLNQFTLAAAITSEDVLDFDEKVMIGGNITYRVKTPDRLSLDIVTDKRERHYFYDGKTVTVYARSQVLFGLPCADTIAKPSRKQRRPMGSRCPWPICSISAQGSKADASNIISAFCCQRLGDQWNRLRLYATARQQPISRSGPKEENRFLARSSRHPRGSSASSTRRCSRNPMDVCRGRIHFTPPEDRKSRWLR